MPCHICLIELKHRLFQIFCSCFQFFSNLLYKCFKMNDFQLVIPIENYLCFLRLKNQSCVSFFYVIIYCRLFLKLSGVMLVDICVNIGYLFELLYRFIGKIDWNMAQAIFCSSYIYDWFNDVDTLLLIKFCSV